MMQEKCGCVCICVSPHEVRVCAGGRGHNSPNTANTIQQQISDDQGWATLGQFLRHSREVTEARLVKV